MTAAMAGNGEQGIEVIAEHVEVETGKGADALDRRPELAVALAEARKSKCPIIAPVETAASAMILQVSYGYIFCNQ